MQDGVAHLLGNTVPGLGYSTGADGNVFVDYMPSTPDQAVAIYGGIGSEPDARLAYDAVDFQVVVRGPSDGVWALEMIRTIYAKLQAWRNQTLPDGTVVVYILATQGNAYPMGPDENGRAQYSWDFRGEIINATEERP